MFSFLFFQMNVKERDDKEKLKNNLKTKKWNIENEEAMKIEAIRELEKK